MDELYSRQVFDGRSYTICVPGGTPGQSGDHYRPVQDRIPQRLSLGVAFGTDAIIDRMEKLQAIVSLRAPGYCQAVFASWFAEPEGWLEQRIAEHQAIRDALLAKLRSCPGVTARTGSSNIQVISS